MAWGRASDAEVASNRHRFLAKHGCRPERSVAIDQVHSANIIRVGEADLGHGISDPESRIPETDGMITDYPGLVLVTSHADCAPLYLLDDKHHAIGLVHAGWKGILAGIAGNAIRDMHNAFGTDGSDLYAATGPMISTPHYEVGADLARQFTDRFGVQVVTQRNGRLHLDLFACLIVDLLGNGLRPERIPARPPCTFTNNEYSSFRRDGERMQGMIAYLRIAATLPE